MTRAVFDFLSASAVVAFVAMIAIYAGAA